MSEYWTIAIEEALDEAGVAATPDQIVIMAQEIESAHEMHSEATGQHIFSANLRADREAELSKVKDELRRERSKVPCKRCKGGTLLVPTLGGQLAPDLDCYKCGGTGRHD